MLMTPKPTSTNKNDQSSNKKQDFAFRLQQKERELNDILGITQAINNNYPEESLYRMFMFTLRGSLNIQKMALFVLDNIWDCKVYFGINDTSMIEKLDIDALQGFKDITYLSEFTPKSPIFQHFDIVIPVFHKDKELAYVFINDTYQDREGNTEQVDTRFVQTLSNVILVAIENKKLVRQQLRQEAIKREMEIAKRVQSFLFPKHLPYGDLLRVKATYFPHDLVGGDYYDFIQISEDKFITCIADVSGKGVPAALLMSNFQAALRTLVRQASTLRQIVEELNLSIYENAEGEHFITFLIAFYNRKEKTLRYINAGHNPALLFDYQRNTSTLLDKGTTILGMFSPLPFLEEITLENIEEFLLFAYTDGVTETANPEGEQFGLDRLLEFLYIRRETDLSEIHGNVISRLNNFRKNESFGDDITLLSCQVKAERNT